MRNGFGGYLCAVVLLLLATVQPLWAEEQRLTIVHTNDMHSHLLGFSPNVDYSPLTLNDDATIGGWARIATVIAQTRADRQNPVLALDAGDFLMGSLFHTISRETALELVLMKEMGIDVTTIGNHEFDFKPEGLARILAASAKTGTAPDIVSSNLIFHPDDPRDDALQSQMAAGLIQPYTVLERDGLRVGIFGLVGQDAAEVSPFAKPVSFGDPVAAAKQMVATLRGTERADVVVCLCHGGLNDDPAKSEDLILAQQVPGIDVIISGHTDTMLPDPITENGTVIVHGLGYGKRMGVIDLVIGPYGVRLSGYEFVTVDDTIPGDPSCKRRSNTRPR